MFSLVRYYFDLFVDFLFGLFYDSRSKNVSKPTNRLVLQSATSLAKKIRRGEVTSEEIVRACVERIKEVNVILNAVVDERFDEAIEEARNVDRSIATGCFTDEEFQKKPLLGVPFTTKEVIAARGLSHTLGLVSRKSHKAPADSDIVHRLKDAGAILLGVTNIPILNGWTETSNPVYGTTTNPHNVTRTPGGSSGGEASIIAACGSVFGIGTEMGGSVRLPAFMCGLFGHKTSSNLVSMKGVMFNTCDRKIDMATIGPLTRHSEDIIPILKVLVGENVTKLNLEAKVDVSRIKVYYIVDPGDPLACPFREEMKETLLKAVGHLKGVSQEAPILLNFEELKYAGVMWFARVKQLKSDFNKELTNQQGRVNGFLELLKFCLRCSDFNIFVICNLIANFWPKSEMPWVQAIRDALRDKLLTKLGSDGVLLYPSSPMPASYHYTSLMRLGNVNLFSIWNALDFCATQVPMGVSEDGLPVGVQVVAAPYHDHLTIAVAKELEKAFGGYVAPFPIDS